jgi:thiamine transporter ThiT
LLNVKKLVLSALFLALALVLPFLTGQIPQVGSALLPMHLPVLLCGLICGGPWGLVVGFVAPLLRHVLFSMPPLMTAIPMAFELAAYGLISGVVYARVKQNTAGTYFSLLSAMVLGRVVWGAVRALMTFMTATEFSFSLFISGALLTAIPGIILQLVLIPILMAALRSARLVPLSPARSRVSV